jgi:1-acyl-sn-glycerol-3-phosphate acyltransferase
MQREIARFVSPLWLPLAGLVLRHGFGWRIENRAAIRHEFRRIRRESKRPLLICANHLTLVDSALVAWALMSPPRYVLEFGALAWNTPEVTNFAGTKLNRILIYLAKCIPIRRGGSREEVAGVLNRVIALLKNREVALLFPEGGRSRTGRVEPDAGAWGIGRVVGSVPDCRVLCVYLRGRSQASWGELPARGESFFVELCCIEPKSDHRGARRSVDLTQQIVSQLVRMETDYLESRQDDR